jgi:hypothetical protein
MCVFYHMQNMVDPDQLAHPCHLIRIYTVHFLVRNKSTILIVNIVDPDQTAHLIWIYTVNPNNKCLI